MGKWRPIGDRHDERYASSDVFPGPSESAWEDRLTLGGGTLFPAARQRRLKSYELEKIGKTMKIGNIGKNWGKKCGISSEWNKSWWKKERWTWWNQKSWNRKRRSKTGCILLLGITITVALYLSVNGTQESRIKNNLVISCNTNTNTKS